VIETLQLVYDKHAVLLVGFWFLSLASFLGTLVALPFVLARIPTDYFTRGKRDPQRQARKSPIVFLALSAVKNGLGVLLVIAGVFMLVLPGQGLLTIVAGFALTNFPGKFKLEKRLIFLPGVFRTVNRIRRRMGRPPLDGPAPQ